MSDQLNELRNEARSLNEPFSPALHARVMAAVRAESASAVSGPPAWRYVMAVAAVMMIALGAWLLTRPAVIPPPRGPTMVKDLTIENPLRGVISPLNTPTAEGHPALAYLDHDAAKLGRFVVRQLDQLPPVNR